MSNVVDFPNIKPTSRSYTPGRYPQLEFVAQNGAKTVLRYGNKKVDAKLTLEFTNITDSEATHTNRFENGVISSDGVVQSVGNSSLSNVNIYHWKPGTQEVGEAVLNVVNGRTTNSNLYGSVFTVKQTTESNRLYKTESITYTDEGLIEVSASHAPLLSDGTLATINYIETDFRAL